MEFEELPGEPLPNADVPLVSPPPRDLEVPLEPPTVIPNDQVYRPSHLSPSAASMFEQCPRKWKHRYQDRLPDPPGVPALTGTFAHRVLELLLQQDPAERTVDRAKELARQVWPETENDADFVALELTDEQEREFRWKGWLAIEGLWALENPEQVQVQATEQQVQVQVGTVPFRGIIDRLDRTTEGLVIADYKSGTAPRPRYAEAKLSQVLLYAAAVEQLMGERPVAARLLYLKQRIDEVLVTSDNIASTTETLGNTWASLNSSIDTEDFAASTGPLCAWCPFVGQCPEGRAEVEQRHLAGRVRSDAPGLAVVLPEEFAAAG